MARADVLVVGGGIAGVAAASFLAEKGQAVVVVEQEATLAYHATGRSAALYVENYGHPAVRPLTRGGRPFFEEPPAGLVDSPLLGRRGFLTVARPDQVARLEEDGRRGEALGTALRRLTPREAANLVPVLRAEELAAALWEPEAADIDVAALHQAFVRGIRRNGGEIRVACRLTRLEPRPGGWRATAGDLTVDARVVVDAAGAWCDAVAGLAGLPPLGLIPKRRTAFMAPGSEEWRAWPFVAGAQHDWYFKPDGVQLLCSPGDETPSPPCDARPDELDVAVAIERINRATTLGIRTVRSAWAGLRTFAPDGAMVIGFDEQADGFFWLAGQGGTGIQTAPAAGRLAAALVVDGRPPPDLVDLGLDVAALAPARLRGE